MFLYRTKWGITLKNDVQENADNTAIALIKYSAKSNTSSWLLEPQSVICTWFPQTSHTNWDPPLLSAQRAMGAMIYGGGRPPQIVICTHRTRLVTEVPLPSRGAEAEAIVWPAGRSIAARTRLVTVQTPASTWTGNRAIHSLPPWGNRGETASGMFSWKQQDRQLASCSSLFLGATSWCKLRLTWGQRLTLSLWPPSSISQHLCTQMEVPQCWL